MANCTNFPHSNNNINDAGYTNNLLGIIRVQYPTIANELYSKVITDEFLKKYIGKDTYTEEEYKNSINDMIESIAIDGSILFNGEHISLQKLLYDEYNSSKTFNPKEEIAGLEMFTNILLELYNKKIIPKNEEGKRKKVRLIDMPKTFFIENPQYNPNNYVKQAIKDRIAKTEQELKTNNTEQLQNRLQLYKRFLNDFENDHSENIYNQARYNLNLDLGIKYNTTEELLEIQEEKEYLTKNWDDEKNFQTNTEEIFNTKTKAFIASIVDEDVYYGDTLIYSSKNELTGESRLVNYKSVLNKLQQTLVGCTTKKQMINRLNSLKYCYGWIPKMIQELQEDEQLFNGFFKDFNRSFLNEEMILLNLKNKQKGNVISQTIPIEAKLSNNWIAELQYRIQFNKLDNEKILQAQNNLQELATNLIAKTPKEQIEILNKITASLELVGIKLPNNLLINYVISKLDGNLDNFTKYNTLTKNLIQSVSDILKQINKLSNNKDNVKLQDIRNKLRYFAKKYNLYNTEFVDLMYFDGKKDKKYGIQLPQMLNDFESMIKDYIFNIENNMSNKDNLLKQYLQEMSKLPQWKYHSWFGENGIFMNNGELDITMLELFQVTILSQIKNLETDKLQQYKEFEDNDWFLSNIIAFHEGTHYERLNKKSIARLPIPTPSDSSIMRYINLPKINTENISYNYQYIKEDIISMYEKFKPLNNKLEIVTKSIEKEKPIIVLSEKEFNNEAFKNILRQKYNAQVKVYNQKAYYIFINKNINREVIYPNDSPIINKLLDCLNSEIVQFEQAKNIIFKEDGTLVDNINDIVLPSTRYFTWKLYSEVKNNPNILWSEQPTTKDTTKDRYVRVFKDEKGYTGTVFKFTEFPKLLQILDETGNINEGLNTLENKQKILKDILNEGFDKYYKLHEKSFPTVKPFLNLSNTSIDKIMIDMYLHKLLFNYTYKNTFLGNFKSIEDANKRAKAPNSGAVTAYEQTIGIDTEKGTMIVIDDVLTPSYKKNQIEQLLQKTITELTKQEQLIVTRRKAIENNLSKVLTEPTQKEIINELVDKIVAPYEKGTTKTDGQLLITLPFFVKLIKKEGKWEQYAHIIEEHVGINNELTYTIKQGITTEDAALLFKPGKPFLHSISPLNTNSGEYVSHNQQIKSSYVIAIPEYIADPKLKQVVEYMIKNNIDILSFDSTQKEEITQKHILYENDEIDLTRLGTFTPTTFNLHDFRMILEVPQEEMDTQSKVGIQIAKIMLSNLSKQGLYNIKDFEGKQLNGEEVKDFIHKIQATSIKKSYEQALEELGIDETANTIDFNSLANSLRKLATKKDRKELNELLKTDEQGFITPLSFPLLQKNFISLFTSVFKNRVTNQKINGGHMVLFSDVYKNLYGTTPYIKKNEQYEYGKDLNVNVLPSGAIEVECKISIYTAALLFPIGGEEKTINLDTVQDKELLRAIGYRIPTTGHQSAIILKIVDILPKEVKSSIVVNYELIARTGTDFDVDSLYLMLKGFKRVGTTIKPYKYFTLKDYKQYIFLKELKTNLVNDLLTINKDIQEELEKEQKVLNQKEIGLNKYIETLETLLQTDNLDNLQEKINEVQSNINKAFETNEILLNALIKENNPKKLEKLKFKLAEHTKYRNKLENLIQNMLSNLELLENGELDSAIEEKRIILQKVQRKISKIQTEESMIGKLFLIQRSLDVDSQNKLKQYGDIIQEIKEKEYNQFNQISDYNVTAETDFDFQPKIIKDNKLIELYISILENEYNIVDTTKASSYDRLQELTTDIERFDSFSEPYTQDKLRERATTGKVLLPIVASINLNAKLFESMQISVPTNLKIILNRADTPFTDAQLKNIFGKSIEVKNNLIEYKPSNLAWNNGNKNFEGTNILDNTAEYVDNAADYVKFPMPSFITVNNINIIMLLEMFGVPINNIKEFIELPIIQEYFKSKSNDITKTTNFDELDKYIVIELLKDETISKEFKKIKQKYEKTKIISYGDVQTILNYNPEVPILNITGTPLNNLYALKELIRINNIIQTYRPIFNADKLSIAPDLNNAINYRNSVYTINQAPNNTLHTPEGEVFSTLNVGNPTLTAYGKMGILQPMDYVEELFENYDVRTNEECIKLLKLLPNGIDKQTAIANYRKFKNLKRYSLHPLFNIQDIASTKNLSIENTYLYFQNKVEDNTGFLFEKIVKLRTELKEKEQDNEFLNRFELQPISATDVENTNLRFNKTNIDKLSTAKIKQGIIEMLLYNGESLALFNDLLSYEFLINKMEFNINSFSQFIPPALIHNLQLRNTLDESREREETESPIESIISWLLQDSKNSPYIVEDTELHNVLNKNNMGIVLLNTKDFTTKQSKIYNNPFIRTEYVVRDIPKQDISHKYEINMDMEYGNDKRSDVKAKTTIDAIRNKERIATTRYEKNDDPSYINFYKQFKIGDVIKLKTKNPNNFVFVKVTKELHKLENTQSAEEWSKKEGWSTEYFNSKIKPKLSLAYQFEYELLETEITNNESYALVFANLGTMEVKTGEDVNTFQKLILIESRGNSQIQELTSVTHLKENQIATIIARTSSDLKLHTDDILTASELTKALNPEIQYQKDNIHNESIISQTTIDKKLKRIQQVFFNLGIHTQVIMDDTITGHGEVEDDIIRLNPNKVLGSTIHHEFGHILIDLLIDNPIMQNLINSKKDTDTYNKLKALYPNLTEPALLKEALVTDIGFEANNFSEKSKLSRSMKYFLHITETFLTKLGIIKNTEKKQVELLASKLIIGLTNPHALATLNLKVIVTNIFQQGYRMFNIDSAILQNTTKEERQLYGDYKYELYNHILKINSDINKIINYFSIKHNHLANMEVLEKFKAINDLMNIEHLQTLLGIEFTQKGAYSITSETKAIHEENAIQLLNILAAVYNESYKLIDGIINQIIEFEINIRNRDIDDLNIEEVIEMSNTLIMLEKLTQLRTDMNFKGGYNLDILNSNNAIFDMLQPFIAFYEALAYPEQPLTKQTSAFQLLIANQSGSGTSTTFINLMPMLEDGAITANISKTGTPNRVTIEPNSMILKKVYGAVPTTITILDSIDSDINSQILFNFKKKIIEFTIAKFTSNPIRLAEAHSLSLNILENKNIFTDATWLQRILEHSKNTHDPLLSNIITMLKVIQEDATRLLESELEIFTIKTKKIDKILKKYKLKETVFTDNGFFTNKYNHEVFWEVYENFGSYTVNGKTKYIPVALFIKSVLGGKYPTQQELQNYIDILDKRVKNKEITEQEKVKIIQQDFKIHISNNTITYTPHLESKFVEIPNVTKSKPIDVTIKIGRYAHNFKIAEDINFKTKKYSQIAQDDELVAHYHYLKNLIQEYLVDNMYLPQQRGALPSIPKQSIITSLKEFRATIDRDFEISIDSQESEKLNQILTHIDNEKIPLRTVSFKYLGYLNNIPTYEIPPQYINEEQSVYVERVIRYINKQYNKKFNISISSYLEILQYNKEVKEKNKNNHNKVEHRPSKFMPRFLKDSIIKKSKQKLESYVAIMSNILEDRKFINTIKTNKLYQQWEDYLHIQFFEKVKKGGKVGRGLKAVLTPLASLKYLGMAIFAGARDLSLGIIKQNITAISGDYYDLGDLWLGYAKTLPYLIGNTGLTAMNSLLEVLNKKPLNNTWLQKTEKQIKYFSNFVDIIKREGGQVDQSIIAKNLKYLTYPIQYVSSKFQETALAFAITRNLKIINGQPQNLNRYIDNKLYTIANTIFNSSEYNISNKGTLGIFTKEMIPALQIEGLKYITELEQQFLQINSAIYDKLKTDLKRNNLIVIYNTLKKAITLEYNNIAESLSDSIEIRNGEIRLNPYTLTNQMNISENIIYELEHILDEYFGDNRTNKKESSIYNIIPDFKTNPIFDANDNIVPVLYNKLKPLLDEYRNNNKTYNNLTDSELLRVIFDINNELQTYQINPMLLAISSSSKIVSKVKSIITNESHYIQGEYDNESKSFMDTYSWTSMLMSFFRWFPMQSRQTLGVRSNVHNINEIGERYYNETTNKLEPPSAMNLNMYLAKTTLKLIKVAQLHFTMDIQAIVESKLNKKQRSKNEIKSILMAKYSKELQDVLQTYNDVKTMPNTYKNKAIQQALYWTILLLIIRSILTRLLPDDEKERHTGDNTMILKLLIYRHLRDTGMELMGFTSVGHLINILNKGNNALVQYSVLQDIIEGMYYIINTSDTNKYITNNQKANLYGSNKKDEIFIQDAIPFLREKIKFKKITGEYPQTLNQTKAKKLGIPADKNIQQLTAPNNIKITEKLYDMIFGSSKSKQEKALDENKEIKSNTLNEKKYEQLQNTK